MVSLATAWGSLHAPRWGQGSVLISSQGLLSHHSWARASVCVCTERSTEACGHGTAALRDLPQGSSHGVRIGQFCFAITAASMATACDVPGKAICGTAEQDGGRRGGWKELQGRWRAACTPGLKGVTHMASRGLCHVLSPGSGLADPDVLWRAQAYLAPS